jgi:hypothetical protein
MNAKQAHLRWYQFQLRTLLILLGITAVGLAAWKYRHATRHMRQLFQAIKESQLGTEDKRLLGALAWNEEAWKSGLILDLSGPIVLKRIAWNSTFTANTGKTFRIYLLDSFTRPVADLNVPATCIVTDAKDNLILWKSVAGFSEGVLNAELQPSTHGHVLKITSRSNWFYGQGVYKYHVSESEIAPIGEAKFTKYENGSPYANSFPVWHADSKAISAAMRFER